MLKILRYWVLFVSFLAVCVQAQELDFSLVNAKQANLLPIIDLKSNSPFTFTNKRNIVGDANVGKKVWSRQIAVPSIAYGPTPADAIAYALADIQSMPAFDRPFQRYIWIPDGDPSKAAAIKYSVNLAVSHSSVLVYPSVVAEGKLLRWDLRRLVPNDETYATLHALWEELQFEPYFHITKSAKDVLPIGAVVAQSLPTDPPGSIRFKADGQLFYKDTSNQIFQLINNKWTAQSNISVQRVSAYGAHVGLDQATLLQSLTQSSASVLRYDNFLVRILSTIDGGMYYKFAGISPNPSEGTSQDAFLRSLGANENLVKKLRSDQRAALFRSNVTGKPRRIDAFYGVAVRPSSGTGLIAMTHDMLDNDVNPRSDPIRNLLNINDQAREVIAAKPNGLHIFALFDGNGQLQNEVPPNIAKDHTVPAPHTARLQPAISCIRCHGSDGGYKPFQNDVQTMLSGLLDVFGDLSNPQQTVPEQLDRLAGLYSGDLSKPIRRARNDYSDAVFRVTGGYSVSDVSDIVSQVYGDYMYESVDAFKACYELGYLVPPSDASKYLIQLLPPLPSDRLGISPEDPVIGALKSGLKVNRYQWEQVYPDAAFRALQTRKINQENINQK